MNKNPHQAEVAIVGAGAMGSLFAARLLQGGVKTTLVDGWQTQVETLRKQGLSGLIGEEAVTVYPAVLALNEVEKINAAPDVLILFVKATQLEETLQQIKPLLGEETQVVCLLNGVGHERLLSQYISPENLHLGVTVWASSLKSPGHFTSCATGRIELQNQLDTQTARAAAETVVAVLNRGNLGAVYSEQVKFSIWRKACVNGASNALCALLDCRLGELFGPAYDGDLIRGVIAEFAQAAALQGVQLDVDEMTEYVTALGKSENLAAHYPSMHQDLIKNHRTTEVESLNGAVAQILKAAGQAAPINQTLTQLIHAKEALLIEA